MEIMNTTHTDELFVNAVDEFKVKQKEVAQSFIDGILALGSILVKHKEVMTREGKRVDYCKQIGIHISQANNYVRMHEYAKETENSEMLGDIITNRAKINLFLSLPNEEKQAVLSDPSINAETSSEEFKQKIVEIRGNKMDDISEVVTDDTAETHHTASREVKANVKELLQNIDETVKIVIKKYKLWKESKPHVEALLALTKAITMFKEVNVDKLSEHDMEELRNLIGGEIDDLNNLLLDYEVD